MLANTRFIQDTMLGKDIFNLMTHSTHFIYGYMEGRKEMFYLTTHTTHFILRLYGIGHMVKDHSDSERGNHMGYSFRLAARVLFYASSHRQDNTPVVEHWLDYVKDGVRCSSVVRAFAHGAMGRQIDPSWWTH